MHSIYLAQVAVEGDSRLAGAVLDGRSRRVAGGIVRSIWSMVLMMTRSRSFMGWSPSYETIRQHEMHRLAPDRKAIVPPHLGQTAPWASGWCVDEGLGGWICEAGLTVGTAAAIVRPFHLRLLHLEQR